MSDFNKITLKDGRIQCRVKITGTWNGKLWEFTDPENMSGSQFIHPDGDTSEFWWSEGNMSCDCNRIHFIPWATDTDRDGVGCGDYILIDSIVPIDPSLPSLYLNESANSKGYAS